MIWFWWHINLGGVCRRLHLKAMSLVSGTASHRPRLSGTSGACDNNNINTWSPSQLLIWQNDTMHECVGGVWQETDSEPRPGQLSRPAVRADLSHNYERGKSGHFQQCSCIFMASWKLYGQCNYYSKHTSCCDYYFMCVINVIIHILLWVISNYSGAQWGQYFTCSTLHQSTPLYEWVPGNRQ